MIIESMFYAILVLAVFVGIPWYLIKAHSEAKEYQRQAEIADKAATERFILNKNAAKIKENPLFRQIIDAAKVFYLDSRAKAANLPLDKGNFDLLVVQVNVFQVVIASVMMNSSNPYGSDIDYAIRTRSNNKIIIDFKQKGYAPLSPTEHAAFCAALRDELKQIGNFDNFICDLTPFHPQNTYKTFL